MNVAMKFEKYQKLENYLSYMEVNEDDSCFSMIVVFAVRLLV